MLSIAKHMFYPFVTGIGGMSGVCGLLVNVLHVCSLLLVCRLCGCMLASSPAPIPQYCPLETFFHTSTTKPGFIHPTVCSWKENYCFAMPYCAI
jgi:hypothetical protein